MELELFWYLPPPTSRNEKRECQLPPRRNEIVSVWLKFTIHKSRYDCTAYYFAYPL